MQEYSIPAVVEIAPSASLADVVFERADREPEAVIMRRQADGGGPPWREVTAAQFRGEVTALAKGLIAAGIGAGDRVALLSRTRYEWTLADYAILAAGAVTVPIYETSSAEQVEWILSDSGARALIAETPRTSEAIAEVLGRLPGCGADLADRRRGQRAARMRPGRWTAWPQTGAAVSDDALAERRSARSRRRPGHHHLHLRDHGPPQGMPAHAREHARRRAQRDRRPAGDLHRVRALGPAVPAPGAFLRADHPGRLPRVGHRPRAHRRMRRTS